MRLVNWLVIVLTLSAFTACDKKGDKAKDEKSVASTGAAGAAAETINVKLLDAGSEPRQKLRYKFAAGRKDTMMMEMKMDMELTLAGTRAPKVPLPAMHMGMDIDSKEVTSEGNLRYEFKLTTADVASTPGVAPMVASQMKTELAKMEGLSGWAVVTPRGFTRDAEINVPAGAGQQLQQIVDNMRQQIKQMSSPFPEEAVGKGARWEVEMPIDTPALKINQKAKYELLEVEGSIARMKVAIEQTAPKQRMNAPNMPPGTSADLDSLESEGEGTMSVDLTKPVPESEMTARMEMESTIKAQGQTQGMDMKMTMGVKIWPK